MGVVFLFLGLMLMGSQLINSVFNLNFLFWLGAILTVIGLVSSLYVFFDHRKRFNIFHNSPIVSKIQELREKESDYQEQIKAISIQINQRDEALEKIVEEREEVNNALQNDGSNIDLESMLSSMGFSGTGSLNNGYYKLPDGLIIQWGTVVCYATWNVYNYPIAFPHAAVIIVGGGSSNVSFSGTSAQGITSVKLNNAASFSGRFGAGNHYGEVNYIAIGY